MIALPFAVIVGLLLRRNAGGASPPASTAGAENTHPAAAEEVTVVPAADNAAAEAALPPSLSQRPAAVTPPPGTVAATYPHDPTAFTQGLFVHAGSLYESTGLYGSSGLRRVDLATGAVLAQTALPEELFGEARSLSVRPSVTSIVFPSVTSIVRFAEKVPDMPGR